MAIYRTISMSFWTDSKVVDDFTPEDRYFYLYLFTNPHTNLCGCYEISIRQMANELGYAKESVENLIKRFESVHDVIRYSPVSKEILLLNWHKYNWTKSEKFRVPLIKEIEQVKDESFRQYLCRRADIPYRYGIDTNCIDITVSDTDTDTVSNTVSDRNIDSIDNLQQSPFTPLPEIQPDTLQIIIDAWNAQGCTQNIDGIPLMRSRYNNTRQCIGRSIRDFLETIKTLDEQAFFRDQAQTGNRLKYDWFVNPDNYQKVVEGNYKNSFTKPSGGGVGELKRDW